LFFCYLGDIIIERWIPYGHQLQRRTIVESATAAITYSAPRNQIIIYEGGDARIARQFEKYEVVKADPAAYVARYGASLLDSATLAERARTIGVHEDLVKYFFKKSSKKNINFFYRSRLRQYHLQHIQHMQVYRVRLLIFDFDVSNRVLQCKTFFLLYILPYRDFYALNLPYPMNILL
jgi:hypothetical protein